jgi:hypothetical protein
VIGCLVVALLVAATVHPVCITTWYVAFSGELWDSKDSTSFLFSGGLLFYLVKMSRRINEPMEPTTKGNLQKSK